MTEDILLTNKSSYLKGVFAKNERGYKLRAIDKRFDLILLLSVASIKRKLLKTTHAEERIAAIQIQKVATYDSDRKQINLIPNQIIQILQTIGIDYFSTQS